MAKELLSILIPARNEEPTIIDVLKEVKAAVKSLPMRSEIIVVDDGSTDNTMKYAKRHATKVISNSGPHGKGYALRKGFEYCRGDVIVMMDADYSHIAADIPKLLEKLKQGCSLVIGSRALGGSEEYGVIRGFGNWVLSFAFRLVFGIKIYDALNGFKAFTRKVITNYEYHSTNYEIEIELIANALKENGKISEVPSYERARAGGIMKSSALKEGYRFLKAIIKLGIPYRLHKWGINRHSFKGANERGKK